MLRHYLLLIVLFCMFISACSIPEINHPYPEVNRVETEKKFCIVLPENHQDGYTWQLAPTYNKALVAELNAVWHGNEKGIYFNFKALAVGQTTLEFVKRKYTDTADVSQYVVKISDN